MTSVPTNNPIFRITALWAFAECALGGVMHALKLPFTGFFVGGFAVLCIGLLAHFSGYKSAVILRSTLLVVLVKAIVSPHSTPMAYLAVSFQGIAGAFILCYVRPRSWAAYLFGFVALVESAFQKIIVLLLFFGKPLVEAIDAFFADVLKGLGLQSTLSGAQWVVYSYVGLYAIWGLVLGRWITRLPDQIQKRKTEYAHLKFDSEAGVISTSGKRKSKWILPLLTLLFMVLTFLFTGGKASGVEKAVYAVLRSVAVLLVWFFWVQPLVGGIFRRWAQKRAETEKGDLSRIMDILPELRFKAGSLYQYVKIRYKGLKRLQEFVVALFIISIYPEP